MTIERMLRRGQFPILATRPLDESETSNVSVAKVYVVEVGAYSDRYIDAIFTTRALAEAFVADRQRRAFEREGRKAHRVIEGWSWTEGEMVISAGQTLTLEAGEPPTISDGRAVGGQAIYRDVPAETFDEFLRRHTWNEFGDVEEYDLWDVLPVVPEE